MVEQDMTSPAESLCKSFLCALCAFAPLRDRLFFAASRETLPILLSRLRRTCTSDRRIPWSEVRAFLERRIGLLRQVLLETVPGGIGDEDISYAFDSVVLDPVVVAVPEPDAVAAREPARRLGPDVEYRATSLAVEGDLAVAVQCDATLLRLMFSSALRSSTA